MNAARNTSKEAKMDECVSFNAFVGPTAFAHAVCAAGLPGSPPMCPTSLAFSLTFQVSEALSSTRPDNG